MQGKARERWRELCEQAANEQDPRKLLEIVVEEINRLLAAKYDRLSHVDGASKIFQRFHLTYPPALVAIRTDILRGFAAPSSVH
jgi:hypothetical protein